MAQRSVYRTSNEVLEYSPYEILAHYYRKMMEHVDYRKWALYLNKVLKRQHCAPKSLLELGAGTGLLAEYFQPDSVKFRVTTDLVPAMIARARQGAAGHRLVVNAAQLPFRDTFFDLILMTYDAINYLSKSEIRSLMNGVAHLLSDSGVFLFDVTTDFNSLTHFSDFLDVEEFDFEYIVRRSWYEPSSRQQFNQFDFFTRESINRYLRTTELHVQNIYPIGYFKSAAERAGLIVRAIYSDFTLKDNLSCAERVQFVVSKPQKGQK